MKMKKPVPTDSIEVAIATVQKLHSTVEHLQVRLLFEDGRITEGQLLGVADDTFRLALPKGESFVASLGLRRIEVAMPKPIRQLIVALSAILGGTTALVLYSLLPWVIPSETDWPGVFAGLATVGAGLWFLLLRRPAFRRWLTDWSQIYPATK